jgi:hypothetical protein
VLFLPWIVPWSVPRHHPQAASPDGKPRRVRMGQRVSRSRPAHGSASAVGVPAVHYVADLKGLFVRFEAIDDPVLSASG